MKESAASWRTECWAAPRVVFPHFYKQVSSPGEGVCWTTSILNASAPVSPVYGTCKKQNSVPSVTAAVPSSSRRASPLPPQPWGGLEMAELCRFCQRVPDWRWDLVFFWHSPTSPEIWFLFLSYLALRLHCMFSSWGFHLFFLWTERADNQIIQFEYISPQSWRNTCLTFFFSSWVTLISAI